jgi:hypothetical protein
VEIEGNQVSETETKQAQFPPYPELQARQAPTEMGHEVRYHALAGRTAMPVGEGDGYCSPRYTPMHLDLWQDMRKAESPIHLKAFPIFLKFPINPDK